jgi:hypothetical protein
LDVRLNNVSQLAGFTKRDDLRFFLAEILAASYRHELDLAPTATLLDGYRAGVIRWSDYEVAFLELLKSRRVEDRFGPKDFEARTVLLCSEPTASKCHRRLVLEYLRRTSVADLVPVHL